MRPRFWSWEGRFGAHLEHAGRSTLVEILVGLTVGLINLVNMTEQVNVQDAKTRLSELLARVERGEDFVIARGGHPVARLSALQQPPPRELGFVPGGPIPESFFEPLSAEELKLWSSE